MTSLRVWTAGYGLGQHLKISFFYVTIERVMVIWCGFFMRVSQYFIGDGLDGAPFGCFSQSPLKATDRVSMALPFQTAIYHRISSQVKLLWQQLGGQECACDGGPSLGNNSQWIGSLADIGLSHKQLPLLLFCQHPQQRLEACGIYLSDALRDEAFDKLRSAFEVLLERCRLVGGGCSSLRLNMQLTGGEWLVTAPPNDHVSVMSPPLIRLYANTAPGESIHVLGIKGREVPAGCLLMHVDVNQWARLLADQVKISSHATWPMLIAPFQVHLLPLLAHKSFRVKDLAWELYHALSQAHIRTLIDDRRERVGAMFASAQRFGAPLQLMVSERGMDSGVIEWCYPLLGEKKEIPVGDVFDMVRSITGTDKNSSCLDGLSGVCVD